MTTEKNIVLLTWQAPVSSKAPEAFRLLTELGGTDAIDLHDAAVIERGTDGVYVLTDGEGQAVTVGSGPLRDLLDALDGPAGGAIADPASLPVGADGYEPKDWKSLTEVTVRLAPGRAGVVAHVTINSRTDIDHIVDATGSSVVRIHEHELHREINAVTSATTPAGEEPHESLADRAHGLVDKLKNKLH